jgi:hypothetical protein
MVKQLIGPLSFDELLGEAKAVALEGHDVSSPTGLLFSRLLQAVEGAAKRHRVLAGSVL